MKRLLVIFVICILSNQSYSQMSVSQAGGIKYFMGEGEVFNSLPYSSLGFVYSPRLNFVGIGRNSTLSLGTHAAFTFQTNSAGNNQVNSQDHSSGFGYDLPLVLEYNFGLGCNVDSDRGVLGFYIGGGYGLHDTKSFVEPMKGPVITGGARINTRRRYLDITASYQMGDDIWKNQSIMGIGIQYFIGMN